MRKYLAATAALSCALLLASCASTTDPSSDDATAPTDETTTAQSEVPEPTVIEIAQSCAGFYDGAENSLATRVDATLPLTAEALTDESAVEITTTRDKIASVQRFADVELQENLNGIKAPFEASLTGATVETDGVQPALDGLREQCTEAGYAFAS